MKSQGFSYFLLLFYSQALGVDAALVGLAIFITFMVDAVTDPLVGYISDNTKSKWGRRHPYMYAAAIPVTLAYWFLWNPPDSLTGNALFPYLLTLAIFVRILITFYEIPASALIAEFTSDYDQRTSLLSYRNFFGWIGGVLIGVIALSFFLEGDGEGSSGYTDVEGFGTYGLVASIMIFFGIMISTLGTHRTIPYLRAHRETADTLSIPRLFREVFETLSHKSFAALFIATFFSYTAAGVGAALAYYLWGYFWEFTPDESSLITLSIVLSAAGALFLTPRIGRKLGKKKAAIYFGVVAFTIAPMPVFLRLLGLMPANGDPILFPLILGIVIIDYTLIIMVSILVQSMVADLVEDSELRTGRRSEGLFFAAISFSRKAVEGGGIFLAAIILALIDFPKETAPADVPTDAVFRLGVFYAPTMFTLWMLMLVSLSFYKIDRGQHEANLRKLAERNQTED